MAESKSETKTETAPTPVSVIRVAADSKPQRIAGAIAHSVRAGGSPAVTALGAGSVNQAVKAVIIALGYLRRDGLSFTCTPAERKDIGRDGVQLTLRRLEALGPAIRGEEVLLKSAAHSDPSAVAGAVAGKVRAGQQVAILGIGADAVKQAVKAVYVARRYLARDGFNLQVVPRFVEVELEAGRRNAVKLSIVPVETSTKKGKAPAAGVDADTTTVAAAPSRVVVTAVAGAAAGAGAATEANTPQDSEAKEEVASPAAAVPV